MKIQFITREDRRQAGARVRCYNFARELSRLGFRTDVFSFSDHLGALCADKERQMTLCRKLEYNRRAFIRLVGESRDTVFFLQRLNYHALAPLAVSACRGNKVIFDCDDWNIREDPRYRFGLVPSSGMEYLTRTLARHASACTAASRFLQAYLSRYAKRVFFLPTAVDAEEFCPRGSTRDDRVVFSWMGTAYHAQMGENLRFVISCFSALAAEFGNIALSLAGEGRYYQQVRAETTRNVFSRRIEFIGWIDPEQVPGYLGTVDVGLLPLVQHSRFNRGKSPTKLFEYMSMAKATVSSRIGEASRIIDHGRTGCLAGNRTEFIAQMRRLVLDPGLRDRIGHEAREEAVQRYSLRVAGVRLAAIIEKLYEHQA